ncbi:MAG: D-alanyl-D-alanine carboxypeptidase [Erysipelotrichaceae bacterium]|nr:D-alanyl-D-alanine carboxypeptidase [Erysipelotrichaceae bacterium]
MKKILSVIISMVFILNGIKPVDAFPKVSLNCKYAYVLDGDTSRTMYDKKGTVKMYPASMTKIMTAYLALTKIDNLDEKIKISKKDVEGWWAQGASICYFKKGEKVTYRDLLYGCLFPSGADACRSLAINTYGSEKKFINAMNETAAALGCKKTHFVNTTGLHSKNHYTTCEDLTLILREAMNDKRFAKIFTDDEYHSTNKKHYWVSTLTKTRYYAHREAKQIEGAKSGYTNEAGRCLVSSFMCHGHRMFMAVGKAPTTKLGTSLIASDKLSKMIIENTKLVTVMEKGTNLLTLNYNYLIPQYYQYTVPEKMTYLIDSKTKDASYTYKYKGLKTIDHTIKEGDKIGDVDVYDGQELVVTLPLYAYETIEYDINIYNREHDYVLYGLIAIVAIALGLKALSLFRHRKKEKIF